MKAWACLKQWYAPPKSTFRRLFGLWRSNEFYCVIPPAWGTTHMDPCRECVWIAPIPLNIPLGACQRIYQRLVRGCYRWFYADYEYEWKIAQRALEYRE